MAYGSVSPMSEEFHDWLEQCPVGWYRNQPGVNATHVEYGFEIDGKDN